MLYLLFRSRLNLRFTAIRDKGEHTRRPRLVQYNEWGLRIDKLQTSEGWRELKEICQREGIPAIFYERKYGEHSRIYGFSKVLLMVADSRDVCIGKDA